MPANGHLLDPDLCFGLAGIGRAGGSLHQAQGQVGRVAVGRQSRARLDLQLRLNCSPSLPSALHSVSVIPALVQARSCALPPCCSALAFCTDRGLREQIGQSCWRARAQLQSSYSWKQCAWCAQSAQFCHHLMHIVSIACAGTPIVGNEQGKGLQLPYAGTHNLFVSF